MESLQQLLAEIRDSFVSIRDLLEDQHVIELENSIVAFHDPEKAPEYYAFEAWPGLDGQKLDAYDANTDFQIPRFLRTMYSRVSGINLGPLLIYGPPRSFIQHPPGLDRMGRQPLDISTANKVWKAGYQAFPDGYLLGHIHWNRTENAGIFSSNGEGYNAILKDGTCVRQFSNFEDLLFHGCQILRA